MLHTDYQLAVSHGYLVRFCLKIKRYQDIAHHWTALLTITRSWAKLCNTHTHEIKGTNCININCKYTLQNELT
jgi:hypothetical protein